LQSDDLNDIWHLSTIIIPMTSKLINEAEPLRFRIKKRWSLDCDSDLLIDQIRSIDNKRFCSNQISFLNESELLIVEEYLKMVLALDF